MSNVRVVDTLTDGNSSTLTLTSGPTLTSGNASSLAVNGALTYQATFVINQQSVDSGSAVNNVSVSGETPKGVTVTDVIDTPVVVNIPSSPSIGVNKSVVITDNGDGVTGIGDIARLSLIHI